MSMHALSPELLTRLAARGPGAGPDWLASVRAGAAEALRERGLPTSKTEAWRFTPVRGVIAHATEAAEKASADNAGAAADAGAQTPDRAALLSWIDQALRAGAADSAAAADEAARIAVVNGRVLSSAPAELALPDGIEVARLADAGTRLADTAALALGKVARVEHFTALNGALFSDALVVHVAAGARPNRPLHVVYAGVPGADETATSAYPRLVVVVEPGADLCLIETTLAQPGAPALACAVTEVVVGTGATVEHVRAHYGTPKVHQIAHVAVRQAEKSDYRSRVVTLGGSLNRLDLDVTLAGKDARCRLDGAYLASRGEHVDHQTRIDHQVPSCQSAERYRGIIDDGGHAVFDGTIMVQRDAQHSDAHQENHNLLLADGAVVNTKPHLRIDADDVSCSHGTTVGSLDDGQLFYLRTRGIGEDQARAILTYAFVRAIIEDIPHAPIVQALSEAVRTRLPHGELLDE